ncbi:hypothetical protein DTO164E3_8849 [Paecilomyces variotii]|nr:hypothetical protein DTO164E3_8849 [Paecilomyces variotii]
MFQPNPLFQPHGHGLPRMISAGTQTIEEELSDITMANPVPKDPAYANPNSAPILRDSEGAPLFVSKRFLFLRPDLRFFITPQISIRVLLLKRPVLNKPRHLFYILVGILEDKAHKPVIKSSIISHRGIIVYLRVLVNKLNQASASKLYCYIDESGALISESHVVLADGAKDEPSRSDIVTRALSEYHEQLRLSQEAYERERFKWRSRRRNWEWELFITNRDDPSIIWPNGMIAWCPGTAYRNTKGRAISTISSTKQIRCRELSGIYATIPYAFPAAVPVTGLGSISDALVGRVRWDNPAVQAELYTITKSREAGRKYIHDWRLGLRGHEACV